MSKHGNEWNGILSNFGYFYHLCDLFSNYGHHGINPIRIECEAWICCIIDFFCVLFVHRHCRSLKKVRYLFFRRILSQNEQ